MEFNNWISFLPTRTCFIRALFLLPLKPVTRFAIIPLGTRLCLSDSILRVRFFKCKVYKIPGSDSLQNFGIPKEAERCKYAAANWGSPVDWLQLSHSFRRLGNTYLRQAYDKFLLKEQPVEVYHNLLHCKTYTVHFRVCAKGMMSPKLCREEHSIGRGHKAVSSSHFLFHQ